MQKLNLLFSEQYSHLIEILEHVFMKDFCGKAVDWKPCLLDMCMMELSRVMLVKASSKRFYAFFAKREHDRYSGFGVQRKTWFKNVIFYTIFVVSIYKMNTIYLCMRNLRSYNKLTANNSFQDSQKNMIYFYCKNGFSETISLLVHLESICRIKHTKK